MCPIYSVFRWKYSFYSFLLNFNKTKKKMYHEEENHCGPEKKEKNFEISRDFYVLDFARGNYELTTQNIMYVHVMPSTNNVIYAPMCYGRPCFILK